MQGMHWATYTCHSPLPGLVLVLIIIKIPLFLFQKSLHRVRKKNNILYTQQKRNTTQFTLVPSCVYSTGPIQQECYRAMWHLRNVLMFH